MRLTRKVRARKVGGTFPGLVLIVCALLPLHPMMHDHVELHGSSHPAVESGDDDHGTSHHHPLVDAAGLRVRPQVAVVAICNEPPGVLAADAMRGDRNARSFGGILSDHDVGWHVVLSTFLI